MIVCLKFVLVCLSWNEFDMIVDVNASELMLSKYRGHSIVYIVNSSSRLDFLDRGVPTTIGV